MKKIKLKIILLAVFIILPLDVSASVNPVVDYQTGIYSNRVSNGITYYGQMGYIYVNNKITYCVKPIDIIGSNYEEVSKLNNLTEEQIKYFELVSHFGYNTSNHNNIYYYMATQELIWEHIYGINDVYWTTNSGTKGNIINIDIYKNEISDSVSLAYILPMFNTNTIMGNVGDTFELVDNNNVLKNYKISNVGNNEVWIQNNSLFIKINDYSSLDIVLTREENDYFSNKFFASSIGQDLSQFGLNYKLTKSVSVLVNPYSSLIGINIKNGGSKVKGKTTFKIFNNNTSQFVNYNNNDVFETDDNGYFLSSFKLPEGNYKIINMDIPTGYIYGGDTNFEIKKNNQLSNNVFLINDNIFLALGNLKINTYYQIDNQDVKLSNLFYEIYAEEDVMYNGMVFIPKNNLVAVSKTDIVDAILFQGKYYVMVYNAEGELLSNTHYTVPIEYVDPYSDINQILNIKMDYNVSNININVKEKGVDNLLINLPNMKYDVYALEDIYLNNILIIKKDSLVENIMTDENGNYTTHLLYGKYYLKETSVLEKYNITDDQIIDVNKENNNVDISIIKTLKEIKKDISIKSDNLEELPNTSNYNKEYYILFVFIIVLGLFGLLHEKKN